MCYVFCARVCVRFQESNHREEMFMPGQFVATLIGPGGANIRQLQTQFRVKIDVHRDKENVVIAGHKNNVQQTREAIAERLGTDYEAAQRAREAQKAAQAPRVVEADEGNEKAVSSFPVIPPGAPQGLVERLTAGGKSRRRRKKTKAVDGEEKDEAPAAAPSGSSNVAMAKQAPEQEVPAPAPAPAPAAAPKTAQPALKAEPTSTLNGDIKKPTQSAPVPNPAPARAAVAPPTAVASTDAIYAAPPPGLEDAVAAPAPSPTGGKSDELLAMLLGDSQAASGSSSKSPTSTSAQGGQGDKVEYYTSSSGFSIRL